MNPNRVVQMPHEPASPAARNNKPKATAEKVKKVYHLMESDRVVHYSRHCCHLQSVRDVHCRLVERRVCLTCGPNTNN